MKLTRPLVLASASPRRREILEQLGLVFTVQPANVDESLLPGEDHDRYVVRLAAHKAHAAAALLTDLGPRCVLGADTTVVLEGKVFGKPENRQESEQMLRELRGREHIVYTGVALWLVPEAHGHSLVVNTRVLFRSFSDATLRRYVDSGEGLDKAGSYGIQELGAGLVSEVHGSYSNVVGLPAAETIELLEAAGVLAEWP
jgi:septum formation protein